MGSRLIFLHLLVVTDSVGCSEEWFYPGSEGVPGNSSSV
jgi:hypothetical protein